MICQTVKIGAECGFMTKKGCAFNGGTCHVIIERCDSCVNITDYLAGQYCKVYPDPASKWLSGNCPKASHIKKEIKESAQKLNPLKASKRSSKK